MMQERNEFRSQVPAPPPGVEFTFLRGHFDHALTDRLAALPEHSIVFLVSLSLIVGAGGFAQPR